MPRIQFFTTCENVIRTIPTLPYSEKKVEDVDTNSEDHLYDAIRYVLQDHPIGVVEKPPRVYKPYDPFSTEE